jgi:predicted nucleotidyltransferase/DNA-binding XRE family transcriptional regulator
MSAGTLLREARTRARLSQTDLARRAGVAQSVVSAYEAGHRQPSLRTLQRLVAATGGRLVLDLEPGPPLGLPDTRLGRRLRQRRQAILDLAEGYGVTNLRVFGSVARGEDDEQSDVDLMADIPPTMGLFALIALERKISEVLGVPVDLAPSGSLKERIRERAEKDLIPL